MAYNDTWNFQTVHRRTRSSLAQKGLANSVVGYPEIWRISWNTLCSPGRPCIEFYHEAPPIPGPILSVRPYGPLARGQRRIESRDFDFRMECGVADPTVNSLISPDFHCKMFSGDRPRGGGHKQRKDARVILFPNTIHTFDLRYA